MTAPDYNHAEQAAVEAIFPLGTSVTAEVLSVGGRSELVTGEVVGHRRVQLAVTTECHGTIMVPAARIVSEEAAA